MEQEKRAGRGRDAVPRKRKRLKYIAVLPSTVTLLNAFCGFMAIVYASRGLEIFLQVSPLRRANISFLTMSGYMILFAMIADMLDGQVARWSGAASDFGGQLDSLSDCISFGVAPAFLMLKVMEAHLGTETFIDKLRFAASIKKVFPGWGAWVVHMAGRWFLFAAIVYVLCAVIRLARFNVENDTDNAAHNSFAGLPSPAAAGVVVSLVIFRENFLPRIAGRLPVFCSALMAVSTWLLPFAALGGGILMVTRIRYVHAANRLLAGKKTFATFVVLLFAGLFAVWNIQIALVLGFWGFALSGLVHYLIDRIRNRKQPEEKGFA
ncbi:MAG: CDP-alcohol phosphatidyltransferase family protein [Spirochaetaceae bacterium]|jgi:CDP-diacylglycerol--serine O-phosphatidyltransferase|nr:CDP-alcohol phosphatidyltransferase family protein [Spirochaetaceae bacterium]